MIYFDDYLARKMTNMLTNMFMICNCIRIKTCLSLPLVFSHVRYNAGPPMQFFFVRASLVISGFCFVIVWSLFFILSVLREGCDS